MENVDNIIVNNILIPKDMAIRLEFDMLQEHEDIFSFY